MRAQVLLKADDCLAFLNFVSQKEYLFKDWAFLDRGRPTVTV